MIIYNKVLGDRNDLLKRLMLGERKKLGNKRENFGLGRDIKLDKG